MIGTKKVVDTHHNAFTDGRNEFYGRAFIMTLTVEELRYVQLHENKHKLYKDLITFYWMFTLDEQVANAACDYSINLEIEDENSDGWATPPRDAAGNRIVLYNEKYRGKSKPEIFYELYKEKQQDPDNFDKNHPAGFDEHGWEEANDMPLEEKHAHTQEVEQAISAGITASEKLGTGTPQHIKDLLKPQVKWLNALRNFIQKVCRGETDASWRTPERRAYARGMLRPTPFTESVGELVVGGDMSMSMDKVLPLILTEIKAIGEQVLPDILRILYWDSKVCGDEKYGQGGKPLADMMKSTKPIGGGGTRASCVPEYMREKGYKPQAVIMITDGHIWNDSWGTWDCPVLWCIINNPTAKPPTGKVLHITGMTG
jgi:predicted metal-dependent peptidase|tara:strand:+ start:2423 stop:3535 length:1113 start_codon:yes stop_codon:yes gene_type:complete